MYGLRLLEIGLFFGLIQHNQYFTALYRLTILEMDLLDLFGDIGSNVD